MDATALFAIIEQIMDGCYNHWTLIIRHDIRRVLDVIVTSYAGM